MHWRNGVYLGLYSFFLISHWFWGMVKFSIYPKDFCPMIVIRYIGVEQTEIEKTWRLHGEYECGEGSSYSLWGYICVHESRLFIFWERIGAFVSIWDSELCWSGDGLGIVFLEICYFSLSVTWNISSKTHLNSLKF